MIKIPYGILNFANIVEQNRYYVDKTKYIKILEKFSDKCILFIRPRRFCKILFILILNYYNITYKDKLKKLSEKYYIDKNISKLHKKYLILNFSYSCINTKTNESAYKGFLKNIKGAKVCLKKRK